MIRLQPRSPLPPKSQLPQPQQHGQNRHDARHDGLEHQSSMHVARGPVAGLLGVARPARVVLHGLHGDEEDGAEQLAAGPAHDAARLGRHGEGDLGQVLEGDGHEGEGAGAQQGQHGGGAGEGARRRHEGEDEVAEGDERRQRLDGGHVGVRAVRDGRQDGRRHEPHDDEQAAGDAGVGFAVVVGREDLVDEGGEGVEEADVDGERDENQDEGEVAREGGEGAREGGFGQGGGG